MDGWMDGWMDGQGFAKEASGVSAMLWAGFPGPAGASAIAETIFGLNAPSGRLTQTFYGAVSSLMWKRSERPGCE